MVLALSSGVVLAMLVAAATGGLPVALAADGRQHVKITAAELGAVATGVFPQFVQDADGDRQPVVVVGLGDVRVRGLCASGAVPTPVGTWVLRLDTPPDAEEIRAGDVQFAIESVDGLGALGQRLLLNREQQTPEGIPLDVAAPGNLPILAEGLQLDLAATVRWASVADLGLSGLDLRIGDDVAECF
ncbi:hypothetical protein Ae168Ps1_5281 [Pseudonocardia sp. Ae168_Ps1]|uniref:DUF6230 family protein n=1 Tax=unclassified Pseudonocardia TaxID=2619320 RepID=UPI0001FFF134|nr:MULTISPECIES: DUF6230 family protein [unclassified Pseudonocardia]ALE74365.1 hypothetical protein FRP1_17715 [Pseudonocardia sp. EC080625-04]ALL77775.1 hypothetical protein AD006_25165 [Pseudonocardia sp. EC080610-09]ALL80690.1 hypothetical protein AD017_04755 [Pseudonocardia sp. EC080619-01]OLL76861.1 hypothetical protein Ae150APs1_5239 [Pseudonocardia sp. Ae150A_Ps1]OLL82875.1 hypothetical protein Ae168Ps1_5281 [Pseudonocardia sp. Ae168_Ps1]